LPKCTLNSLSAVDLLPLLDRCLQFAGRFLHITDAFLNFALELMLQPFGLLLFAANQLPGARLAALCAAIVTIPDENQIRASSGG
jgi:hypothetical protein